MERYIVTANQPPDGRLQSNRAHNVSSGRSLAKARRIARDVADSINTVLPGGHSRTVSILDLETGELVERVLDERSS
jgi:hypothetical protein